MTSPQQTDNAEPTRLWLLFAVAIMVGIASGIIGIILVLLLHSIQHVAYGYSLNHIISPETFLAGVRASSPIRRVEILSLCGLIAGLGWWALYRYDKPLVSIADALKFDRVMPARATMIHVLLQIFTIALGSPLGREVAPREAGAIYAYWFASKVGLNQSEIRIMLACGAGAGLAAVYNVPLAGALFVMEVLLCSFSWSVVIPALLSSVLAVLVSWIALDTGPLYDIIKLTSDASLLVWSIIFGPVFGLAAHWFIRMMQSARQQVIQLPYMPFVSLINFALIGVLAIYFPSLLGNGKSPVQLTFSGDVGIQLGLMLLILRVVICWSSLKVGAQGGLLTPSLANGALMAVVLGGIWQWFWPGASLDAFALVGATAFLASAQKMPLTAIVLMFEFTHLDLSFLVPIMFAVSGAVFTAQGLNPRSS